MSTNEVNKNILDYLYDGIRGVLDHLGYEHVPVIYAYTNAPEPKETYCALHIYKRKRSGRVQETVGSPLDRVSENFYTNYYVMCVQVSFVGNQSEEVAMEFEDSVFSSRQCIHALQRNLLGPIRQSSMRDLTELRESEWIKRYNIDLELSYAIQSHEEIDWIDEVVIKDLYGFDPVVDNG